MIGLHLQSIRNEDDLTLQSCAPGRFRNRASRAMGIVYLFTTTIHTSVLGALSTFARTPLYASLDSGLDPWLALTPLEDQQLGDLIGGCLVRWCMSALRWCSLQTGSPLRLATFRGP